MRVVRFCAVLLSISCLAFSVHAQTPEPADPDKLRALCQEILCREPRPIRLTLENGKLFESNIKLPTPIVQNDWISILPGESLFIEADIEGDRVINLRAVSENKAPEKTFELRFWQEVKLNTPGMLLVVRNPFPKLLKYHAVMMLPNSEQMYKTSSCPVLSNGRGAYEMWPHPIFQLMLFDFRLVEENKDGKGNLCEF